MSSLSKFLDTNYQHDTPQSQIVALPEGTYADIKERRISELTCRKFDYQVGLNRGLPAHLARVKGQDGHICAVHVRTLPKTITWVGKPKGAQLFGQHQGGGGHLIITEGEIDAMSVYEATWKMTESMTIVSITSGVNACLNNLKANLKFISGFSRVTIFFDQDDVGRTWAVKAAELLGPKTKIVSSLGSYKDANEAWVAGERDLIRSAIRNARSWRPDKIVTAIDLFDEVLDPKVSRGLELPWSGWNKCTEGLKPGEVWLIAGGSGIGKSLFTRSIALHLAMNGTKVAYIALEESCATTMERMLSEALAAPFHLMSKRERQECKDAAKDAAKKFAANLYLLDQFGSDDFDTFISTVKYYVCNEETPVVILDHFSLLADGIALNTDQRRAIDKAIKDIKTLAMDLKFTFIVVSHLSRSGGFGPSHEEGGGPTGPSLSELRGSHSLAQIPDYIWMLQRNPLDTVTPNETSCWLKKNRVKGEVGLMTRLTFNPKTCRFTEQIMPNG